MGEQICNPLTVLDIRLSSRDSLDVISINQQHLKATFEKIEDRFPVNTRAFHGNMGNPMGQQPIMKYQKIRGHGAKGPNLFLSLIFFSNHDTGYNSLFVDIQSTAAFINDLHDHLLISVISNGRLLLKEFTLRAP